ncbi:nuclear transport factor 2 family protein [Spirosoma lituiforme]
MRHTFALLITLFFTATGFAQPATTPPQDPTALGNAFFKALLDEDGKALERLISSDLDVISFDGQSIEGEALMEGLGNGTFSITTSLVSDEVTRLYNDDSAVMTGSWQAKGTIQGQAYDDTVTFSIVSAKQAGIWKIVNVQFTPTR